MNYLQLLKDLKEILETVKGVSNVSHGKAPTLDQESTFTSIYIAPTVDNLELFRQGTKASDYQSTIFIRALIHLKVVDDLDWVQIREDVIKAVLNDTEIWTELIDRDVVSVIQDDFNSYPLKAMEILFEFKLRESC